MTLEEFSQRFVTAMEYERASYWLAGDVVVAAIEANAKAAPDARTARKRRASIFRHFAQQGRCSLNRVRQLAQVAAAFPPGTGERESELPWSVFRAAVAAGTRLHRDPHDIITQVIDEDMGVADLAHLGKENGVVRVQSRGTCVACSAQVSVSIVGDFAGMRMRCPFCAERLKQDGITDETAAIVGVLA